MKTYLLNLWDRLSGSYWFIPVLFIIVSGSLALTLPDSEAAFIYKQYEYPEWILTTLDASRTTLSVIFTAMLGLTGTVFSITVVVLSLTSQQYGPRLLRGFLHDNPTQLTLGSFLATTVYSLLLLRRLEAVPDGSFSLHISVLLAVVMTLCSIGMLIYYINHIAVAIQAPEVIGNVARECHLAIDRLYPDMSTGDSAPPSPQNEDKEYDITIKTQKTGYVQALDLDTLLHLAQEVSTHIKLFVKPGDYLSFEQDLASFFRVDGSFKEESLCERVNNCLIVGAKRTPRQDLGCALLEIVEVAVRALSPGINDPRTAVNCIDHLGSLLCNLSRRKMPDTHRRDEGGHVRLVLVDDSFSDYLNLAFGEIRECASFHSSIYFRLMKVFGQLSHTDHVVDEMSDELKEQVAITLLMAKENLHEALMYENLERFSSEVMA